MKHTHTRVHCLAIFCSSRHGPHRYLSPHNEALEAGRALASVPTLAEIGLASHTSWHYLHFAHPLIRSRSTICPPIPLFAAFPPVVRLHWHGGCQSWLFEHCEYLRVASRTQLQTPGRTPPPSFFDLPTNTMSYQSGQDTIPAFGPDMERTSGSRCRR
ncbi:hypothetical protein LZ31DRAFT_253320 [Colletotrichum somersetense]|nr:hypothetical protein LZ31DRAFT_253320 [Colletotrichum somersetense]